MPPSAPPVIVHMPSSGAPWWAPYLLAGLFVLVGAAIGLLSTHTSDRRKLAADDRRQWDKEIRDLYLQAVESCATVEEFRWETRRASLLGSCHMLALQETHALETIASSLELIANEETVKAARNLAMSVRKIADSLHDGLNEKEPYREMLQAQRALLQAVKVNLRTATDVKRAPGKGALSR